MKVGGFSLGSILAVLVVLLALLGIVGVTLPALAVWVCILILALAILIP